MAKREDTARNEAAAEERCARGAERTSATMIADTPPDASAHHAEILIVDDDARFVHSLVRQLEQHGFGTRAAADVEAAIREIKARAPDVVLLDVYFGEENGLDFIAAIRTAGFSGPLIVLSADPTFVTAHRAAVAGADGYVVKGIFDVIPDLLRCLERRAGRSGALPEPIPVAALSYLESRGLSAWELSLVVRLAHGAATEKEIAARTGRAETAVRKGFESIRKKLGASSRHELARMIGVLSCFGGRRG